MMIYERREEACGYVKMLLAHGFLNFLNILSNIFRLQLLPGVMVVQFVLVTGWFFTISLHRYSCFLVIFLDRT